MTAPVVELREATSGTLLWLRDPCRPFQDEYGYSDRFLDFTLDLHAEGLQASLPIRTYDGDQLPEFVHQLAEDFHGWDGQRTWESCERDLRVDARHRSRGIVELAWTGRHRPVDPSTLNWWPPTFWRATTAASFRTRRRADP